jgi:hypothetical protein
MCFRHLKDPPDYVRVPRGGDSCAKWHRGSGRDCQADAERVPSRIFGVTACLDADLAGSKPSVARASLPDRYSAPQLASEALSQVAARPRSWRVFWPLPGVRRLLPLAAALIAAHMGVACGPDHTGHHWAVCSDSGDRLLAAGLGARAFQWRVQGSAPFHARAELWIDGQRVATVRAKGEAGGVVWVSLSATLGPPSWHGFAGQSLGSDAGSGVAGSRDRSYHFILGAIGGQPDRGYPPAEPGAPGTPPVDLVTQSGGDGVSGLGAERFLSAVSGVFATLSSATSAPTVSSVGGVAMAPGAWEPLPPDRSLMFVVYWDVPGSGSGPSKWELWLTREGTAK